MCDPFKGLILTSVTEALGEKSGDLIRGTLMSPGVSGFLPRFA